MRTFRWDRMQYAQRLRHHYSTLPGGTGEDAQLLCTMDRTPGYGWVMHNPRKYANNFWFCFYFSTAFLVLLQALRLSRLRAASRTCMSATRPNALHGDRRARGIYTFAAARARCAMRNSNGCPLQRRQQHKVRVGACIYFHLSLSLPRSLRFLSLFTPISV